MNSILTNVNSVVPANSGGTLVFNKAIRTHETYHGQSGWFRYELQSGLGNGDGGTGGGVPAVSNSITGVFYHNGGNIIIHIGGNGFNGGNRSASYAGSGGSGAGEETYIISGQQKFFTERVKPGNGSNGNGNFSHGGFGILSETADKYTLNVTSPYPTLDVNYCIGNGTAGGSGDTSVAGQPGGGWGNNVKGKTLGFGWGGGGGGGTNSSSTYGGGGGGSPGWTRLLGDTAAGYCRLFYIGL